MLTTEKIIILKDSYKIRTSEISDYKANRLSKINKKHLRIIRNMDRCRLVDRPEFKPLFVGNSDKIDSDKVIVLIGIGSRSDRDKLRAEGKTRSKK